MLDNGPDIILELDRIERLFDAMPFDMARPSLPPVPAIDRVVARLGTSRRPAIGARFVVHLTSTTATPALQRQAADALREFCRQRADENRSIVRSVRRNGRVGFPVALLLLGLASTHSALFEHFHPLPATLNRLFSEGFLIIGWVVMWRPLEAVLFDWLAASRTAKVYERIAEMELVLVNGARPA